MNSLLRCVNRSGVVNYFSGGFSKGVFAKDAILKLISKIGIGGATGYVIVYSGTAVSKMRMDEG